jgi:methylated-DNA-[protein]-cysteine S-methyltransferase
VRTTLDSPVGPLALTAAEGALVGVHFDGDHHAGAADPGPDGDVAVLAEAARQLDEYFAGGRTIFDLPLAPVGTPFQLEVWQALRAIPYGVTCSYGELAARIGRPAASRAVGLANGRNPLSIVVPCHRVIGSTGTLTGYGGGLERKRWLLDLERGARLFA